MDQKHEQLQTLVTRVASNEKRAFLLSTIYVGIALVVGSVWLVYSIHAVRQIDRDLDQKTKELNKKKAELDSVNKVLEESRKQVELLRNTTAQVINKATDAEHDPKRAAAVVDNVISEKPAVAELLPRIYIHIRDESQRDPARRLAGSLQKRGYIVPGIQKVESGADYAQVRYFKDSDADTANQIAAALKELGLRDARADEIKGYENSTAIRPGHFELWLAPNSLGSAKQ